MSVDIDAMSDAARTPQVRRLRSRLPARLIDSVAENVRHCRGALDG